MWCLETLEKINASGFERPKPDPLRYHPRVLAVRRFVNDLPVPYEYKMRLKRSIHRYADQIIARPVYGAPGMACPTRRRYSRSRWGIGTMKICL